MQVESNLGLPAYGTDEMMTGPKSIIEKNGSTFIVGNSNAQIGPFRFKKGSQTIGQSDAIENFNFTLEELTVLLNHVDWVIQTEAVQEKGVVKLVIWQLGIVMLASALEAYGRKRLLEFENSGKIKEWKELFHNAKEREEITLRAKRNGRTRIEQLIEERDLNFNNVGEFARLYEAGCGLKMSDLEKADICRIIRFRNDIVHGGFRSEMLNWDKLPKQTPIPISSEKVRELMDSLRTFVEAVHSRSLAL